MGKVFEQMFYERRYMDGKWAHEKLFIFVSTREMQIKDMLRYRSLLE